MSGLLTNILAGIVFFVIDLLLIVVLLPFILHWLEERRWKTTRKLMGERVFILNERLDSWWIDFSHDALDRNKYDGTVRTPRIFTEIDHIVEQFAYAMNPGIKIMGGSR